MPPSISFAMGSLGFLTPFAFDDHASQLNQLLDGGCHLTLRARLSCVIERAHDSPLYREPVEGVPPDEWQAALRRLGTSA